MPSNVNTRILDMKPVNTLYINKLFVTMVSEANANMNSHVVFASLNL